MRPILALVLLFLTTSLLAESNQLGLGAMIGNPTGLNGKYWLSADQAIDGGLGFSVAGRTRFEMHSDYLFHSEGAFVFNDVHPLDLYYGLGGRMEFADTINIGLRVPVGLSHRYSDQAADMFAEIAPILDFVGKTGIDIHVAFGARYYF
jgi:hypothetical protein